MRESDISNRHHRSTRLAPAECLDPRNVVKCRYENKMGRPPALICRELHAGSGRNRNGRQPAVWIRNPSLGDRHEAFLDGEGDRAGLRGPDFHPVDRPDRSELRRGT